MDGLISEKRRCRTKDQRYPYTYACDLIRSLAGYEEKGTKISYADASNIRHRISSILEMSDEDVAKKLADYFLENEEILTDKAVDDFTVQAFRP